MEKKLTKCNDKKVSGVCSGLAKYLDLDPTIVRVGYAAVTIFSAAIPGIVLYFVLAVIMPDEA